MQRHRHSPKLRKQFVEILEARQLLSSTQISFTNFASTTGLVTNGYGSSATTSNNALQLTDGGTGEARSTLFGTKVPIDTFTSHFSFQIAPGGPGADGALADGLTFVIDNGATSDLGIAGQDLGYSTGTFGAESVDLQFNVYNLGQNGSTFAFASGGNMPQTRNDVSPINFHSGDTIDATVTYDGTNLAVNLVDANTSQGYTSSEAINLPQVLGASTAYVGFTGATGNDDSIQTVNNFDFSGTATAPTVTIAAASSPTVATGTKTHLSVTAVSNTGGTLSYAWTVTHVPSGAPTPTVTPNNSTSANTPIAHFFKDGTYRLRVTVTDSNGGSTVSDLSIVVAQTATVLKIAPHKASIKKGSTEQFVAKVYDQFGHVFRTEPTIAYAVETGGGSIGASSGLYSASGAIGHLVISADADDLDGIAGAVVVS